MSDEIDIDVMEQGCLIPSEEELMDFAVFAAANTSPFSVLGAEQYNGGQLCAFDDPDLQEWLDRRIDWAKTRQLKISAPVSCLINQSSLGSCSGASATSAHMTAIFNNTLFGVPCEVSRLNCGVAYLKARGSWGSGLSITKMQQTLMQFGNASAASAGEYSTRSASNKGNTTSGFDNDQFQCWTVKADTADKVERLLQAGIPVCYGSNNIPSKIVNGRIQGYKRGSHAMHFGGYDWKTGLIRWNNSWGKQYGGDLENGWGAWLTKDELRNTGCFGGYGSPYGILAPEYRIRKN